jgi:epidermal growth factor receptor substrate 15
VPFSGENAKQIFEKAKLPNETLGRIWNLADTEQRGVLGVTEFIIAMHLLASYKSGALKALPTNLPAGLVEAASRRGPLPGPPGRPRPDEPAAAIPRQFSGAGAQRNQSPMGRPLYGTPPQSAQPTGNDWPISPQEKLSYDSLFNKVDTLGRGYITGEQAVQFFSDSGLPEDILAAIWELADINSEGQLSRDEFAVAMYLIRQQRKPGIIRSSNTPSQSSSTKHAQSSTSSTTTDSPSL